ncbi:MAG: TonB-dependent receptor [Steroidobacteraceae bacterium]
MSTLNRAFGKVSRGVLSVGLCCASTLHAQERAEPSTEGTLEEIVVSAQRRVENAQDVPIALVAFTAEDAAKLGAVDPQTLATAVPGLNFDRVPTASTPFLRGVGTPGSTIGNEPSVAFYVDDVYVPNGTAGAFEFNNIEGIEVLRGPQGTTFGRNATGGVIHVHTRDPSDEPTLDAAVSYGNFDTIGGQVYGSAGLSDTVAVNLAAYGRDQREGWGRNIITGTETFLQEGWGARTKLLWKPSDATSVTLNVNVERLKGDIGQPARVRPGTFTRSGFSPDAAGADFYDGTTNTDNYGEREFEQASAKIRHEMSWGTLQSISAYAYAKFLQVTQDNDGSPTNFFNAIDYPQGQSSQSQELQLFSPADSSMTWLVGAFYFHDNSYFDGRFTGLALGPAGTGGIYGRSKTNSLSAYAQATKEIVSKTNLTLGVRYTEDRRDFEGNWHLGTTRSPTGKDDDSWGDFTGRVAVDYKFTDDLMAYAAYNRGFKSGIFNIAGVALGSPTPLPPPVDPEHLDAYTLGFKSQLLDGSMRLNAEAFYYDYKNIQVFNITPTGTQLLNGGAATIKGIDVDIAYAPIASLTFTLGLEYLDGEYDTFENGPAFFPQPPNEPVPVPSGCDFTAYPTATGPTAQRPCDLGGNDTIQTPPWSVSLGVDYEMPTAIGPLSLAVAYSHRDDYFAEPDNTYTTQQPKTDNVNASLTWSAASGMYDVRLWGQNLTDEKSFSYIAQTTNGGTRYAPRAPRTYGVTVGVHF